MTADGGTTHSKTNTADSQCRDWLSHDHLAAVAQTVLFQRINLQGFLYLCLVWNLCFVKSSSKIIHVKAHPLREGYFIALLFHVLACAFSYEHH